MSNGLNFPIKWENLLEWVKEQKYRTYMYMKVKSETYRGGYFYVFKEPI